MPAGGPLQGELQAGDPSGKMGAPHRAFPSAFLPWNACFSSVVLGRQIFLLSACAPLPTFQSRVTVLEELSMREYRGPGKPLGPGPKGAWGRGRLLENRLSYL